MQDLKLTSLLVACVSLFPGYADAFWRLPCRGRAGLARLDPIVEPGKISGHTHAIHGAGNFGMSSDQASLLEADCTSCAVTQDKSAYWHPALFFMHPDGSAEIVPEIGGMLVYYLLYGDNITAFPTDFRMLAGDPFLRNWTLPVPDPPKSEWTGKQGTQEALARKAVGFNCLNYKTTPEATLERHFLPDKAYLDEHCTDGVRFELMFPSCWNGKDLDAEDHKSHMAYPSLVMDGTCPEGFETRVPSILFETIWDTSAFKGQDGYFALANGDPTGFGYHGDFMQGWEDGVLQEAIDTCTNESGNVEDCAIFNLQSENDQRKCEFPVPLPIKDENCDVHRDGLPGGMPVEWGPERASMKPKDDDKPTIALPTISIGDFSVDPNTWFGNGKHQATSTSSSTSTAEPTSTSTSTVAATTSSTSTSTPSPTPTAVTSTIVDPVTEEIVYVEREIAVLCDGHGKITATSSGPARTVSTAINTVMETSTTVAYVKKDTVPEVEAPPAAAAAAAHLRRHAHHRHRRGHN